MTGNQIAPEYPYWRGYYDPWVRPRYVTGLPAAEVYKLSCYGDKWDVVCYAGGP